MTSSVTLVFKALLTKVISYNLNCPFPDPLKLIWAKSNIINKTWIYYIFIQDYRILYFLSFLQYNLKSYYSF